MIHSYSTAAMNRIALLSLNWWRPGDPRTPLSLASILEWCLRAFRGDDNIKMHLIDRDSRGNLSDVVHEILTLDPTILGIGVYAWNSDSVRKVIKSIRELGFTVIIVLGGPEITFGNNSIFLGYPEADYCVRGEGEYAFEKLSGVCWTAMNLLETEYFQKSQRTLVLWQETLLNTWFSFHT